MTSAESFMDQLTESSRQSYGEPIHEGLHLLQDSTAIERSIRVHRSDISYTLEVPEGMVVDGIAYISPGFGGIKMSSDPLRNELVQAGMATVSFTPGRRGNTVLSDLLRAQELHAETLDAVAKDIGNNLFTIKKMVPNGGRLDPYRKILIPHSMGGLSAVEHAEAEPGQIDKIVNLAAAGYSKMTLDGLAKSISKGGLAGVRHEVVPFAKLQTKQDAKRIAKDVAYYYGGNPIRTGGEIISILGSNLGPRARKLGGHGIRFAYYSMEHDCLVLPDSAIENYVDYYEELKGMGHLGPQTKPRLIASKIMGFVQGRHSAAKDSQPSQITA